MGLDDGSRLGVGNVCDGAERGLRAAEFVAPRDHCERETCHNERGRSRLCICVDVANAVLVSATMQLCA